MGDSMQVEEPPQTDAGRVDGTNKAKTTSSEKTQLPGTTAFPISKVSKIIKADKDVHMCQREAVFLISCAAEHFLKRLTDAAYTRARIEKRGKSVLYKDLASVCSQEAGMPSEYFYLEDIVPRQVQTTIKPERAAKTAGSKHEEAGQQR